MGVHRLNHAVLYVNNVDESVDFYSRALGFRFIGGMPGRAAFLQAPESTNDHDLGLFQIGEQAGPSQAGSRTVGLYHLAWEVDTLQDLKDIASRLSEMGALVGASDHSSSKSLYAKDPSGLEFEVEWMVPLDQLTDEDIASRTTIRPLDIDREIARFGASRRGGIGLSRPDIPSPV